MVLRSEEQKRDRENKPFTSVLSDVYFGVQQISLYEATFFFSYRGSFDP